MKMLADSLLLFINTKQTEWQKSLLFFPFCFWDRVLLYSPGWPTGCYIDQAGLTLMALYPPRAGRQGVCYHAWWNPCPWKVLVSAPSAALLSIDSELRLKLRDTFCLIPQTYPRDHWLLFWGHIGGNYNVCRGCLTQTHRVRREVLATCSSSLAWSQPGLYNSKVNLMESWVEGQWFHASRFSGVQDSSEGLSKTKSSLCRLAHVQGCQGDQHNSLYLSMVIVAPLNWACGPPPCLIHSSLLSRVFGHPVTGRCHSYFSIAMLKHFDQSNL